MDNNQEQNLKMVYGNAELRWYMGPKKRFYIGGSGNAFDLHLHWNMLNSLFGGKGRGYEGRIYNGRLIIGYQARLSNALSMDFNIGGGYNSMRYKEYVLDANGRKDYVDNGEERSKSILGPTQAEIALVWRFGRGR